MRSSTAFSPEGTESLPQGLKQADSCSSRSGGLGRTAGAGASYRLGGALAGVSLPGQLIRRMDLKMAIPYHFVRGNCLALG